MLDASKLATFSGVTAKVEKHGDNELPSKTFRAEADMVTRPGFSELLDRVECNGVRVVIVEDASRLARDVLTSEIMLLSLIQRGVTVYASNGENLIETDDHIKNAMRQIAGVFSELGKKRLVAKLHVAHKRKAAAFEIGALRAASHWRSPNQTRCEWQSVCGAPRQRRASGAAFARLPTCWQRPAISILRATSILPRR